MPDRKLSLVAASVMLVAIIAQACGGASNTAAPATAAPPSAAGETSAPAEPVELTLWHNYGTEANATATDALIAGFEAKNPGITVKSISQPADQYFDLLQAAAISKTGPDLATQWTGLFDLKYADYLQPLNDLVPMDELKKMKGIDFASLNFNADDGVLVVPLDLQFYNGFYNKDLFDQAGITSFPTTWDELFSACDKLKAAGITPFTYGTGGQALGGGFYPWYDISYLMMYLSPDQWKGLYTGEIPWTDPAVLAQFEKWGSLFTKGCTNSDVLTNQDSVAQFEAGQAAMTMEGTWQIAEFQEKLGDTVGGLRPALLRHAHQGCRRVRRRRVRHDHLFPAPDRGCRVPGLHGLRRGPADHRRQRDHPDQGGLLQRPADGQGPPRAGDGPGLHALPDDRQRDPARGQRRGHQGAQRRIRRRAVDGRRAEQHGADARRPPR